MKKFLFIVLAFSMVFCMVSCKDSSDAVSAPQNEVFVPDFVASYDGGESRAIEVPAEPNVEAYSRYNISVLTPALVGFQRTTNPADTYDITVLGQEFHVTLDRELLEAGTSERAKVVWGWWSSSAAGKRTPANYLNIFEGYSTNGDGYLRLIIDDKNTTCTFMQIFVFDPINAETKENMGRTLVSVYCDDIDITNGGKTLHGTVKAMQICNLTDILKSGGVNPNTLGAYPSTDISSLTDAGVCPETLMLACADWLRDNNFNGVFLYSTFGYEQGDNFAYNPDTNKYESAKYTVPTINWNADKATYEDVEAAREFMMSFDDSDAKDINVPFMVGFEGSNNSQMKHAVSFDEDTEAPTMYAEVNSENVSSYLNAIHNGWTLR